MIKGIIVVAASLLVFAGCCRGINCDCIPGDVIYVHYESDSLGCPPGFSDLVSVGSYSQNNNALQDAHYYYNGECEINLTYVPGVYWVISSDSLQIADTLIAKDVTMRNSDDGCCDCGPRIANITLELNGEVSAGNSVVRKF